MPRFPLKIIGVKAQEIVDRLVQNGAHADQVDLLMRHWLQGKGAPSTRAMRKQRFSNKFSNYLPQHDEITSGLLHHSREFASQGGAVRCLHQLRSGQTIESVVLPRQGVCISSQVGCAVGCTFCMTGTFGLLQQLSSGEMLAQVVAARKIQPIRKVVFMGMGEPSHNLDAVLEATDHLARYGEIAHKNIVISSIGDRRLFAALEGREIKPALAISLHSTRPELRQSLVPRGGGLTAAELIEAADRYARASGYPIQYQWTLLDQINDGDDEVQALAQLLKGRRGVLNLIPYNHNDGLPYRRTPWPRAAEIARTLHRLGILTKLRHSAGQDVDGGCGQLRIRAVTAEAAVAPQLTSEAGHETY